MRNTPQGLDYFIVIEGVTIAYEESAYPAELRRVPMLYTAKSESLMT